MSSFDLNEEEESFLFNLDDGVFRLNADSIYVINTPTLDYADKRRARF